MIATGCGDRMVRLWSMVTFECMRTVAHDIAPGRLVATPVFSVRLWGGVLASGGEDKTVKLWSLADTIAGIAPQPVATLAHGATVRGIAISSKGLVATVGGTQKKLIIWRPSMK